jgi:hypothetical protein
MAYSTCRLWSLFSFLIYTQSVGLLGRGISPSQRPLRTHRTTQLQNNRTQTSMPLMGFEPTIPVFERAKTVHTLDRTATVIGPCILVGAQKYFWRAHCQYFRVDTDDGGNTFLRNVHTSISDYKESQPRTAQWKGTARLSAAVPCP